MDKQFYKDVQEWIYLLKEEKGKSSSESQWSVNCDTEFVERIK